jgi:hypothetical protein
MLWENDMTNYPVLFAANTAANAASNDAQGYSSGQTAFSVPSSEADLSLCDKSRFFLSL